MPFHVELRRAGSKWSAVNIRRAKELKRLRKMRPAGLRSFEQRNETAADHAYEQRRAAAFEPALERLFRANARAWAFFEAQTPSYRRLATFWVMEAKRDETKRRRLATLIEDSSNGVAIKPLRRA